MTIVIAILVFGIVVVIHEFGHFIAARRAGILVEEFAIGMGPKLWGIKKGDTEYTLRLFPVGGYCKMLGDEGDSEDSRAFNNKKVLPRMSVIIAGAVFNFILAFLIFFGLTSVNGLITPVVKNVIPGYPAAEAKLQPGDRIVKINNSFINIYNDLAFELSEGAGKSIAVTVKRGNETFITDVTPKLDDESGNYLIGFNCEVKSGIFAKTQEDITKAGFFETLAEGFWTIIYFIKVTLIGVVRLVTLKMNMNDMAGAIGIVQIISTTYTESIPNGIIYTIKTLLTFVAFLSANLGVINLLPLPALDGGRMVFLAIEGIRRKPIDREKEGMIHFAGFVLLMILAVFFAYNDIIKML